MVLPACAQQYTFVRAFGTAGSGDGQLTRPEDVTINSGGNVFVLDSGNNRVQQFTNTGTFTGVQFGGPGGTADNQFDSPLGIGIDSGNNIFVADTGNNRVKKFTNAGALVSVIDPTNNGAFVFPTDVAVAGGNIFVVDNRNGRIDQFNNSGVFQSSFGDTQLGPTSFPSRIAIDSAGNVFVTDSQGVDTVTGRPRGNNRIAEFDSSGNFVRFISTDGSGGAINPNGIAVDASGNVFVGDFSHNRVLEYSNTGVFLTQFGTAGAGDGQFNGADGVALDSSGNVFVTDFGNNRVEEFGVAPVPEAGTLLMLAGMTAGGIFVIRRKQKPQMPANS